jgi:hypothetical protein
MTVLPDSTKALAPSQIEERDFESFVLGHHLGEPDGRRHVAQRLADERLRGAGLAGVVEAEHQQENVPLERVHFVPAEKPAATNGRAFRYLHFAGSVSLPGIL